MFSAFSPRSSGPSNYSADPFASFFGSSSQYVDPYTAQMMEAKRRQQAAAEHERRRLIEESRRRQLMQQRQQQQRQREEEYIQALRGQTYRPHREEYDSSEDDVRGRPRGRPQLQQKRPHRRQDVHNASVPKNTLPHDVESPQKPTEAPSPSPAHSPSQTTSSDGTIPVLDARSSPQHVEAASKIQSVWRMHHHRAKALASIQSLGIQFDELSSGFKFPESPDFLLSSSIFSRVASSSDTFVPPLAHTPINGPLHYLEHTATQIMTQLDGVEPHGDKRVRSERKKLINDIQTYVDTVEKRRADAWRSLFSSLQPAREASITNEDDQLFVAMDTVDASANADMLRQDGEDTETRTVEDMVQDDATSAQEQSSRQENGDGWVEI